MQTTVIRQFSILVILSVFVSHVSSSFHDVTSKVGLASVDGILAAFGDFNNDKSTDLFVISKQGQQLDILTWDPGNSKFNHFGSLSFSDRNVVVNVAPGDFDGDGCMDLAITTQSSPINVSNAQPKKVYISWGNQKELTNIKESLAISEELKDQPLIMDVNGDLLPDLFGTTYNKDNTSLEQRTYWIAGKNRSFVAQTQSDNITTSDGKTQQLILNPLRIPHSNGFLDLTGDMTADLFVTSKKDNGEYQFEIWANQDGVLKYVSPDIPLPVLPNKATVAHVGQSAFADFDGNGKIDQLLPICLTQDCAKSAIYLYSKNKWTEIMINHPKRWQLIPPSSNDSIPNIPLMTIRVGDYNMDGYPDGLIIVHVFTARGNTRTRIPVLLENVPCSGSENCANGRTFEMQWKAMTSLEGAVVATFFDMLENGITDFLIVTEAKGKFHLHAIRNDLYVDASFLKIMVLGGVTLKSCSSDKLPYGVNQVGPYVSYSTTDKDGNLKIGSAGQLSQSGYFSLQCPYIVFGLGRTPNFVDKLSIGMPRAKGSPLRTHTWPSIIPNSQMIIIPYPPDSPDEWSSKLLVTPSKLVLLTALCLLGICVLLAIVIVALHLIEKRADQKEKREDAHKFHFDAM